MAQVHTANRSLMELETARARDFYRYYHPFSRQPCDKNRPKRLTPTSTGCEIRPPIYDSALEAFAEVAAVRLKARRAIISFFDRQHQYVLAEATYDSDDDLWLGTCVIRRGSSCCEYTAELHPDIPQVAPEEGSGLIVIPDLTKNKTFCRKDFVLQWPFGRFYAGVPIRTPQGFNIGAIGVLDCNARPCLTPRETDLLKDMSVAIMAHLDRIRATAEQQRAGKMIRALGCFINSQQGFEDWLSQSDGARNIPRKSDAKSKRYLNHCPTPDHQRFQQNSPINLAPIKDSNVKDNVHDKMLQKPPTSSALEISYKGFLPREVVAAFQRAANLVRDALDVDGVMYLDASITYKGGLVDPSSKRRSRTSDPTADVSMQCDVLGVATSPTCVLSNTRIGQLCLQKIMERHPRGKVWCFDEKEETETEIPENASICPFELAKFLDQGVSKSGIRSSERHALRKLFPGVRTLALNGLFDSHKNKWLAASVVWSCDPLRVLVAENELTYLSAFGDVLMTEVAQINIKIADKAKSDFISSISHELRSPLHGILGSVECLQETDLETSQQDLLSTVKTCGETLLDTVHHILDHSKISTLMHRSQSSFGQPTVLDEKSRWPDRTVDLSVLTEETVETVFAGHAFVSANSIPVEKQSYSQSHQSRLDSSNAVSIGVSFHTGPEGRWLMRTVGAAWRRIILNLVGNSLKYTEKGHIDIELSAYPLGTEGNEKTTRAVLQVSDTGKGMSEDFLQDHLFEPFSQEDFLVPGSGLGMSFCKQIVEALGGKIEVKSQKNHGTKVRVTMDLEGRCPADESAQVSADDVVSEDWGRYRGLRLNFFGVDSDDSAYGSYPALSAIEQTCTSWFGISIVRSLAPASGDFYMTTQRRMNALSADQRLSRTLQDLPGPLIVLCNTVSSAHALKASHNWGSFSKIEFISQPCGPRKLAKALQACFQDNVPFSTAHDSASPTPERGHSLSIHDSPAQTPVLASPEHSAGIPVQKADTPISSPSLPWSFEAFGRRPGLSTTGSQQSGVLNRDSRPNSFGSSALSTSPIEPMTPLTPSLSRSTGTGTSMEDKCRVLLVDDNTINLKLLTTFMEKRGFAYTTASNGLEALESYKEAVEPKQKSDTETYLSFGDGASQPYTFVLMDINMPVMSGFESTRHIRAFERDKGLRATQVIALTGLADDAARQEAYGSGVDLFLTKPVRLKELTKIMDEIGYGGDV